MDWSPNVNVETVLSRLRSVQTCENGWRAMCPVREHHNLALSISVGDNGAILITCHGGCKTEEVARSIGLQMRDLMPPKQRRRIVTTYDYTDESGELLFQVVRYEPKDFRQRRPKSGGDWSWSVKGVRVVPYQLPRLVQNPTEPVFVVEGEKDVDCLAEIGVFATCNAGGATKWTDEHSKFLRGRHVVLLPDNDERGQEHVHVVGTSLEGKAASIRVVELPGLPKKGDVSDWVAAGGTKSTLWNLANKVSTGIPPAQDSSTSGNGRLTLHQQICSDLQIDVLGEYIDTREALVFSHHYGKFVEINKVGYMGYAELLQAFGGPADEKVAQNADTARTGMHSMASVRNTIAILAGKRRIPKEQGLKGPGCWPSKDEDSHENGKCLLVGAGDAGLWDGQKLEKFISPRDGDQFINIGTSDPWYDFEQLSTLLQGYTTQWGTRVLREAAAIFDRWRWEHQVQTPKILAALTAAAWVQTLWRMRPQVGIYGKTNAGKSYLLESLGAMFGSLSQMLDKPTEAGLRQKIGDAARVPLVDEFERSKHRKQILEAIRTSSRGGTIVRGTSGDQRGREFRLQHMFWLFSTELGLRDAPDRNRFILLHLLPAAAGEFGKLKQPDEALCRRLGHELLVVAVWSISRARDLAVELKRDVHGVDNRLVEAFAVPAALWAVATGCEDEAGILLDTWLKIVDRGESFADEETLIKDILAATVRISPSEDKTVAEILQEEDYKAHDHRRILERYGVAMVADRRGPREASPDCVFFHLDQIERRLLHPQWHGKDLAQILGELPGAKKNQRRRISGQRVYGVMVPFEYLEKQFFDGEIEVDDFGLS